MAVTETLIGTDDTLLVESYGPRMLGAVLTLTVGYVVIKVLSRSLVKLFARTPFDEVVETFLQTLLYWAVVLFVVVLALSQLGVDTTVLAAGVAGAGAGVTLGLALKDTLDVRKNERSFRNRGWDSPR